MEKIDDVINFLDECQTYLHSWVCTRTGEYKPYDTRSVRKVLMYEVAGGSKNPIADFKKGVEDGSILLSVFAFAFADEYKKKLYKKHRENVENFEKKYHIKNETD